MKNQYHAGTKLSILLAAATLALGTARADVFTVTNANDSGPGSLRETLVLASSDTDHSILFDPSLDGATITLATGNLFTVRDPDTQLTIDARNLENGITIDANKASRHLVQIGADARLDISGITFINGQANDGGGNDGGSINAAGVGIVLIACRFSGNRAGDGTELHPSGGNGGAVFCAGNVVASFCQFDNNRAGDGYTSPDSEGGRGGDGGAIFASETFHGSDLSFVANRAGDGGDSSAANESAGRGGNGGALHFDLASLFGILHTEFVGNLAGNGGDHDGDENAGAGGSGGAIYLGTSTQIGESKFVDNRAGRGGSSNTGQSGSGGRGGAIVHFEGDLHIRNTILHRNQAGDPGDGGGVIGAIPGDGGAIFSIPVVDGSLHLVNCIVSENRHTAILLFDGESTITSSTIVANSDPDADDAALFVTGSATLTLRHSILGGNTAGPNGTIANSATFGEAVIIEEGINFNGPTTPVDLVPDPLGADSQRFGVPLPGQTQIIDRFAMPQDNVPVQDQRGGNRPFGGLADLGAIEAEYQHDQTIGKSLDAGAQVGRNLHTTTGDGQKINVRQKGRKKASTFLRAWNDGDIDNLNLHGKTKQRGLKVKVFRLSGGIENITGAVSLLGHTTPNVRNGEGVAYRVVTKKKGRERRVRKTLQFDLHSSSPAVAADRSLMRVVARQ